MSINQVMISGNATRDSELRQTSGGMQVLCFSVAVNDRRQVNGEWKDIPNFIDCVMFGSRAGKLANYIKKGVKVAAIGKLRQSTWETNNSGKRSKLEVVVDDIELMSQRQQERQAPQQQALYDEDILF